MYADRTFFIPIKRNNLKEQYMKLNVAPYMQFIHAYNYTIKFKL
jgi:hypothetical protein